MEIGMMIKQKRIEKGMTMKELADVMEVSEGTISRWESGDIENIKRKKIAKLSEVLGLSVYAIMGWNEPDKNSKAELRKQLNEQHLYSRILKYAELLNKEGIAKLEERAEELTEIQKYKKEDGDN